MTSNALISCPICARSDRISPGMGPPSLGLDTCGHCGLVFSRAHFEHDASYHEARVEHERPFVSVLKQIGFLNYWGSRLGWQPGVRILDVGCAEGRLLELGRCMGFEMFGIDVSDYYRRTWSEHGLHAEVMGIESLDAEPFDVVVAMQVIEHLSDPLSFLAGCARLLRPGGTCLMETGDPHSVLARLQGRHWSYWIPAEGAGAHVTFLGREAAKVLATKTGFSLEAAIPSFRYRPWQSYHLERKRPLSRLSYAVQRSKLSSGRCYRFVRNAEVPVR